MLDLRGIYFGAGPMSRADFRAKLTNSPAIADADFTAYDVVYFAGGWGAAFDLGQSELLGQKVAEA